MELGVSGGTVVLADRVLVTIPLGVLEAGDVEFVPALPDDIAGAIGRLGPGTLDRVVLRFEERFWDDVDVIGFAGDEPGLFVESIDLTDVVGEPVLAGCNAGSVAVELESLSDEALVAEAIHVLGHDLRKLKPSRAILSKS